MKEASILEGSGCLFLRFSHIVLIALALVNELAFLPTNLYVHLRAPLPLFANKIAHDPLTPPWTSRAINKIL
jgi:hypothetical protein